MSPTPSAGRLCACGHDYSSHIAGFACLDCQCTDFTEIVRGGGADEGTGKASPATASPVPAASASSGGEEGVGCTGGDLGTGPPSPATGAPGHADDSEMSPESARHLENVVRITVELHREREAHLRTQFALDTLADLIRGALADRLGPAPELGRRCVCGHSLDDHSSQIAQGCDAMAIGDEEVCSCSAYVPANAALAELIDDAWGASCATQDDRTPGELAADVIADPANRDVVAAAIAAAGFEIGGAS